MAEKSRYLFEDMNDDDLAKENLNFEPEPKTERQVTRDKLRKQLILIKVDEAPEEEED